jgi:hypothetical protein
LIVSLRWLLLVPLLGCPAPIVHAQEARGYAAGAATLTIQRADTSVGSGPSIPKPGISGHAFGILGEAGGFVTPAISIGGEASLAARFTSVQETHYFSNFLNENRHRDLMLSAVVGFHRSIADQVRIAGIVGPALVREDTRRRRADQIEPGFAFTGHYGPFVENLPFTAWRFGITTGGDVEVRVGRRAAIVPGLRVHFVRRDGEDLHNVILQMSSVVFRPSIGLRATF